MSDKFDPLAEKCHAEPAWAAARIRELEKDREAWQQAYKNARADKLRSELQAAIAQTQQEGDS